MWLRKSLRSPTTCCGCGCCCCCCCCWRWCCSCCCCWCCCCSCCCCSCLCCSAFLLLSSTHLLQVHLAGCSNGGVGNCLLFEAITKRPEQNFMRPNSKMATKCNSNSIDINDYIIKFYDKKIPSFEFTLYYLLIGANICIFVHINKLSKNIMHLTDVLITWIKLIIWLKVGVK